MVMRNGEMHSPNNLMACLLLLSMTKIGKGFFWHEIVLVKSHCIMYARMGLSVLQANCLHWQNTHRLIIALILERYKSILLMAIYQHRIHFTIMPLNCLLALASFMISKKIN